MSGNTSAGKAGCVSLLGMAHTQTRRNFLLTAPLAAAAAAPLTDTLLHASPAAAGGGGQEVQTSGFQAFTASEIADVMKDVSASHGNKDLITSKVTAMTMTISEENNKSGKEFEYHAHRDHVFQVLDGETKYELGGTPKNARQTEPGEWLAPESEGFTTVTLKKGDYLSVPRMTPHRRVTEKSVTLLLIAARS